MTEKTINEVIAVFDQALISGAGNIDLRKKMLELRDTLRDDADGVYVNVGGVHRKLPVKVCNEIKNFMRLNQKIDAIGTLRLYLDTQYDSDPGLFFAKEAVESSQFA